MYNSSTTSYDCGQRGVLVDRNRSKWPQFMTLPTGSNLRTGSDVLWPLRKLTV